MKTVNIHLAKTQLSRLIAEVVAGGDVVIAKAGKPLVRLVAVAASQGSRPLGSLAGRVVEPEDCWTADTEVEALFHDGELEPGAPHRVAERARADEGVSETTRVAKRALKRSAKEMVQGTVKGAATQTVKRAAPKKP
jgi:prevent-host-death family protein